MRRRKRREDGDEEGKYSLDEDEGPKMSRHNAIRVSLLIVPIVFLLWATTCTSLEKDAGEEMMGLNDFTETGLGQNIKPSSTSTGCETLRHLGITSDHLFWIGLFVLAIWCFCPFCSLKTKAGSTLIFESSSTAHQEDLELGPLSSVDTAASSSTTTKGDEQQ